MYREAYGRLLLSALNLRVQGLTSASAKPGNNLPHYVPDYHRLHALSSPIQYDITDNIKNLSGKVEKESQEINAKTSLRKTITSQSHILVFRLLQVSTYSPQGVLI